MKILFWLALLCAPLAAQSFRFSIHDNTGATPDVTLPAAYQFSATPQGGSTSIMIKVTNTGSSSVQIALIYVGAIAGSPVATPNFTISDFGQGHVLAPGGWQYFTLNFTPSSTGQLIGYLQLAYTVPSSGAGGTQAISTLTGTGATPQVVLTYDSGAGSTTLLPNQPSRLDFGSVSTSASSAITFTLSNETSAAVSTPAVSLQAGVYGSSAFAINTAALPATLSSNGAATFTVTFAPGQTGLTTATLLVGSNSYGIQGTGIVVNDIDALQISYVDATGVRGSPQAATPISFGQLVPGTPGGATLKFTVANPQTSFNPVTLDGISVTGSAYTLSGAPALPSTIAPNASITFAITFAPSVSGTFPGRLAVGSRTFSLTGLSVVSPVPAMSLQLNESVLASGEQVTATVQAAAASAQDAIGQLTMQFAPSVANVTDDPAIVFISTAGRSLSLDLAKNAQAATYEAQPELPFQTGTTAGTLTFTLTFPNTPPLTESYTIAPAAVHISSAQAVRSDPNLVITLSGFDNTYSCGKLTFTFFDTKGNTLNTTPLAVDASSDFHQYFFSSHTTGGSFTLQAKFPVKGDITQIGAVAVTLNNSAGQAATKLDFK